MDLPSRFLPLLLGLALAGAASAQNAPPFLTNVNTLTGGTEDTDFDVTYAVLAAAANESDADGDAVSFILKSGTVYLADGVTQVGANGTLSSGQKWIWKPSANENGTINAFVVRAYDGTDESATNEQVRINLAAVNDPPFVTGAIRGPMGNPLLDTPAVADDNTPIDFTIFQNLSVTDADNESNLTVQVTVNNSASAYGAFSLGTVSPSNGSGTKVYSRSNLSPSQAQTLLRQANFAVTPNSFGVGVYDFGITARVVDTGSLEDSVNGPVYVESVNDPAQVDSYLNPSSMTDSGSVNPFYLSVSDVDFGETFRVEITNSSGAGLGSLSPASPSFTGTATEVANYVRTVSYAPQLQSSDQTAEFELLITEVHPSTSEDAGTPIDLELAVQFVNDPPEIAGITTSLIRTTDDDSDSKVFPFSTVTINDADPGQQLSVTVSLDDPAKGSFVYADESPVVQPLSGSASFVTSELRKVVFKPAPNSIPVNQSETRTITLTVNDGTVTRANSQTRVEVTAVDGAPKVLWSLDPDGRFPAPATPAQIDPSSTPTPFASVTFEDDSTLLVSITLDDATKGTLTDGDMDDSNDLFQETESGSGIYEFTGSAAEATSAIAALNYLVSSTYIFPPGQPGRTDFTITASDSVLNTTTRLLPVVLTSDVRSFLVTDLRDDETVPGTLRHAISKASDNDSIVFAFDSYPKVIRLTEGPLTFEKHLNFQGPGADKLTISGDANSNGRTDSGDSGIFEITTDVTIRGIHLTRGYAAVGGAISVSRRAPGLRAGSLVIEDCVISNCIATQWGGAIDIDDASLRAERCLFDSNALEDSAGKGGGAVSLYTSQRCDFINSTFSGNIQGAPTGYGGGAIYAENYAPNQQFNVGVTHCTFSGNSDAANMGSSVHANVSNTRVAILNSALADFSSRNLGVAGAGEILSNGGNISNDNTTSPYIQGGVPQETVFFNQATDQRNVDPMLAPLATLEGGVRGHRLLAGSPAAGAALVGKAAVDGRGVRRNATADKGAIDADALGKILIHEIRVTSPQFIELFNPRDQGEISLENYELFVDGVLLHTFGSSDVISPGFGLVIAESAIATDDGSTPLIPSIAPLSLNTRGRIEIRVPALSSPVTDASTLLTGLSYVAEFIEPGADDPVTMTPAADSITLAPQFGGFAYAPHVFVLPPPSGLDISHAGAIASPGGDTGNTPFGQDNANPIAVTDRFEINEDEIAALDVLANDLDADGSDQLFIVDLDTEAGAVPPTAGTGTVLSVSGAAVSVTPAGLPLKGTGVAFDPRVAFRSLPEGARVTDYFAYSVLDFGGGQVSGYADDGAGATLVSAPSHRLETGDLVTIVDSDPAIYSVSDVAITKVDDNTFSIPVPFTSAPLPAARGSWLASASRTPSATSETTVEVTVLGLNDPPTPLADVVSTSEETVLRILADPDRAPAGTALDTDSLYPAPRQFAGLGLLANDTDPDTDDMPFKKLKVIGVSQAEAILDFSGISGQSPVGVGAAAHGLADGAMVLISGYGGHPSYNGYHEVTVTGPDSFSIPIEFIDDDSTKGLWTVLNDDNRLATTSALGAAVSLEIRADRTLTNVVYNPRPSAELDGLADGETAADTFYYAVQDTHGAVSLERITVNVAGENDLPVPVDNPPGIAVLDSLVSPTVEGGPSVSELLEASEVLYLLASTDSSGQVNAAIRPPNGDFSDVVVLTGLTETDEDHTALFSSATLLAEDTDVDRSDVLSLRIEAGQNVSREGAAISISTDGSTVTYDPRSAADLQALAFNERVVDTFEVTVFDGISGVSSLVALVVEGRNDSPVASLVGLATAEKSLLEVPTPSLILSGLEIDQNTHLPDNRRFLLPVDPQQTTIFGAMAEVELARRDGSVTAISAEGGLTAIHSAGHGLVDEEEVVITRSGVLSGQYSITRIDADRFSIPVPFDVSFSPLAGGDWTVLASNFTYDPRGSVFSDDGSGPAFTLQGLAAGQTYVDSFEYTLLDGSFLFANDDIFRIEADRSSIELPVLVNDTNLDGVATSRTIVSVGPPSAGGTVEINDGISLIYTPETSFVGDEVFVYTIEDDLGNRASARVTARVTINRLNGNLRANEDRFTVAAGQSPLLNVLANDNITPASGDPLSLVSISSAPDLGGSAVIEGGMIRYTPATPVVPAAYTETFSYTMSGGGTATATTMVTVLVVDRTESLNVRADSFSVPAASSQVVLDVLANDNILPGTGEDLTISSVTAALHGSVTVVDGVALSYTPDAGFLGTDTFSYTASDGLGGGGTTTVTVVVGYLTTNNDIFSVVFDDSTKADDDGFTELDVLANDGVIQGGGGNVSLSSVTSPSSPLGSMTVAPDGLSLRFDPAEDQTGQRDFVYTITDSTGRTAEGTVTVVVIASGIRASSDFFTVQVDSDANELPVLSNDLRISNLPGELSVSTIGTGPDAPDQGGTVEISADFKSITYTAATGFSGVESFSYTVTDGDSFDTARVSIRSTIGEIAATDDSFFTFRGSENNRLSVLSNDRVIPDAGQLIFITATGLDSGNPGNPANRGELTIIEDGAALQYTPSELNSSFPYEETFSYEISVGGTERAEGIVRITVLDRIGARDLDTNNDVFTVLSDSAPTLLGVLANDSVLPASASNWEISSVTKPTANVCSPFLNGDFSDPEAFAAVLSAQADPVSQFLWARFSSESRATLSDPGTSDGELWIALVSELNAAAESGASLYETSRFAGVALRDETQGLLDEGVSGEQLIVLNRMLLEDAYPSEIQVAPSGGAVQISGTSVLYAPQPGFVGTQRFTYRVSDGLGGTGFAEVIVRVGDISVSDDTFTLLEGAGPVDLDVTANDGILRTAFPGVSEPAQGDFTLSSNHPIKVVPAAAGGGMVSNGKVSFTAGDSFVGDAILTYWVVDDSGCEFPGAAYLDIHALGEDRDSAIAQITVSGVNDAPKLINAGQTNTLDTDSVMPFAGATVVEYDDQRAQPVRVRVSYPIGQGVLGGGFTEISPGVLELYGTAAEVTAVLRGLVFTPFIDRITVGTTEETRFTMSLDDGITTTPVIDDTAVTVVTPVNDLSVITGTVGDQKLYQRSSLYPFAGVNITDVDDLGLQPLEVSVILDNSIKGIFTNLNGFVEQPSGSGIYVFTANPPMVSAALRGLEFVPTPGNRVTPQSPEIVGMTVSINDGFAAPVVDTTTSVIVLHGQIDRLLPLDSIGEDVSQQDAGFGKSVSISGTTMAVGSPGRDTTFADAGSVYIYERDAGFQAPWGQVTSVVAPDGEDGDEFGHSVALDDDYLVVGAPNADAPGANNSGAVYVFHRSSGDPGSWTQVARLISRTPNGSGGDSFGYSVAVQGNTILVGAPRSNRAGAPAAGRVYVFERGAGGFGDWEFSETLFALDLRSSGLSGDAELFGYSVALDGNTAVIGSNGANRGTRSSFWNYGAAYIYTRADSSSSWSELKRLDEFEDERGSAFAGFGHSVAISGDRIIVGVHSIGTPTGNYKEGSARIYEKDFGGPDEWGEVGEIRPVTGDTSNTFGFSVAISDDLALIGAPGPYRNSDEGRGSVEVYRREQGSLPTWSPIDRFFPGAPLDEDLFGYSVDIEGFVGIAGSGSESLNPLNSPNAGAARVYKFHYDLGPRQTLQVSDQVVALDSTINYAVDPATFDDPVSPDELEISVRLNDGNPLPAGGWLSFDPVTRIFTGTPTAVERRNYHLVLIATNPLGSSIMSNPFTISVDSGEAPTLAEAYDSWAQTRFSATDLNNPALEASVWGMEANPDGDLYGNLLEMMFGTDPGASEPSQVVFEKLNGNRVSLTFPVSSDFPLNEVAVEWSVDAIVWSGMGVVLTPNEISPGVFEMTAIVTTPDPEPKVFVRIVAGSEF